MFLLQAKRLLIVKKIAELRASNPTPAIVCRLDIDPLSSNGGKLV